MNPFYRRLADRIRELGGMFNAHLHLDRAGTLSNAPVVQLNGAGKKGVTFFRVRLAAT
jgi:hypothetical protein